MDDSHDLFLSYRHVHAEAVRRLRDAFEARGLRVWFDESAIPDFAGITEAARQGIARSKALLAYYAADYPQSRPCQWELTQAFCAAQVLGDPRKRVLVVNPEPGPDHIEPVELRDAKYQAGPNEEGDRERLADAVACQLASLEGPLGDATAAVPPWLPAPAVGAPRFVGRLADMWRVHSALHAPEAGMTQAAVGPGVGLVRGLGGVGKSLLAQEYALRFGAAYPAGIFWLRAHGSGGQGLSPEQREADRHEQEEALARALLDPERSRVLDGMAPEDVKAVLDTEMARGGPCLWVVDDLPAGLSVEELRSWLGPPPAKTLITSRSGEYGATVLELPLGVLPPADGLALLTARRRPVGELEEAAAEELVEELGGHALALDVAGAALRVQSFAELRSALADPDADELELAAQLREELPTGHERSIAATLSRSLGRLGEDGTDFLRLASILAPEPIPETLVGAVFAATDGLDERAARTKRVTALDQARALSLAERAEEGGWRVHRLVARTGRLRDPDGERQKSLRAAAVRALAGELQQVADIRAHARLAPHVAHARELTRSVSDAHEADLLGSVARYEHERGDYSSAEELRRRQWQASRRLLGDEHPETLTAMNNLAATLQAQGATAGARELQERVLEASRRLLGGEHHGTLAGMGNLALTLQGQGDLAGARELQERVLESSRRLLGEQHPDAVRAMGNLAATLQAQGATAGARELQERVLESSRRLLGEQHPDAVRAMGNLALTLQGQGDLAGARKLQERVLESSRRLLGDEHPETLTAMNNLAATLQAQGATAGARQLQERVLESSRRLLGGEHHGTLTGMGNLALTLQAQGDLAGARKLQERVLESSRRLLGEQHPATLTAMNNLALTLQAQGDAAGARELQERVLESSRRLLGEQHPATLTAMASMAATLQAQGDLAGARKLQERVLESSRRLLGDEHPHTRAAMNNLALTLQGQGDLAGARELQERVLEASRRLVGEQHPDAVRAMGNLAGTLQAQGDLDGARELQEWTLEARRRLLGEQHPDTLTAMNNLAATLQGQGDLAGARKLQERALEASRRLLGEQHPHTLTAMGNLAGTLQAQGDLAGARELQERVLEARRRLRGEQHPHTLAAMSSLALTLQGQGDTAGARELQERVLEASRRLLGEQHPHTLGARGKLAATLRGRLRRRPRA